MLLEDGLKRVRECSGLSSGNSLCLLSTACEIGLFALNGLNHLEYKQSSVRGWLTLDVQKCFLSFSSKVCRFFCPCVTQRRVQRGVSLFSHVLEGGRGKSSPFHSIISYLHLPKDFFFSWTFDWYPYYSSSRGRSTFAKRPVSTVSKDEGHFFLSSQDSPGPEGELKHGVPGNTFFWRVFG